MKFTSQLCAVIIAIRRRNLGLIDGRDDRAGGWAGAIIAGFFSDFTAEVRMKSMAVLS